LLSALRTHDVKDSDEENSEEAQELALRLVRLALSSSTKFDFLDLKALPSIQALSDSEPVWSQLLDVFAEQDLEDYRDFLEEHDGFVEQQKLDEPALERKMRLLTFTSLAANTPNREIPYAAISRALQIPSEDVEMWTIDVIRAKLVEGRLSQRKKVFLVQRTAYRVFGDKQWRELYALLQQWKGTISNVTGVLRRQQAEVEAQRQRDVTDLERKVAGFGLDGGRSGGGYQRGERQGRYQRDNRAVEVEE
jgi:translation initiation factor 3 subunit M